MRGDEGGDSRYEPPLYDDPDLRKSGEDKTASWNVPFDIHRGGCPHRNPGPRKMLRKWAELVNSERWH